MTHEEAIKRLDAVIADIRTYYTPISDVRDAEQNGRRIVTIATNVLKNISASELILKAVRDIYFGRDSGGFNQMFMRDIAAVQRQTAETYMSGVKNTIDILQAERDRHQRVIDDEAQRLALDEQRRGNKIQHSALWCSIIATIISLVALVVAVVK
jgi:hypothetical protein